MRLTEKEDAIIVGSILGDGCLEHNGSHVRIRFEHGISQKEYLLWKYEQLKNIVAGPPMKVHAFHRKNQKFYDSLRFYTRSNEAFEKYSETFYKDKRKIIPKNISELLTHPLSLAVWFMDDGYKRNDCNALRLSTDSFNKNEQEILSDILNRNFNISNKLHKKGKTWNIYIPQSSARRFVDIGKPYIIPELKYKIALAP